MLADTRWRLFGVLPARGSGSERDSAVRHLCQFLRGWAPVSPIRQIHAAGSAPPAPTFFDSVFDVACGVPSKAFVNWLSKRCLLSSAPAKEGLSLVDYEKMFCPDIKNGRDIFDLRGINREQGLYHYRPSGPVCGTISSG